ncbi:hypothetical protein ACI01nite_27230 [Acetobacter cibinongensis]|uniref:Uncharacterized protein n=1 Tax=Acetobacter cibinongensis TaxID=146475 RepID=A0A0D6N5X8_9PROT|nr:hypothetical protein [Acetobacter cibinongensis]GAN61427.1 hypothetical protein Abci_022_003 [Acetobacter cibinongensis]GBQ17722.1 hypothetical protein AA0482_1996 [Acetobacter cibinongensis NRIC 0482]GEL60121.1 hypothetical protein ACI01nite_27230 [Acetobacter cibinongensis]
MNSAFAMVRSLVSNFRLAPQLNGLNRENFNLYIEEFDLPEVDRNHIFCSEDRQKAFLDTMHYRDLNHTKKEIEQAKNSLNESGIFFDEKLYITFSRLLSHLSKVWQEQYNVSVLQQNTRLVYTNNFIEVGDRDVKIIRNILRDNLHIKAVGFINKSEIEAHNN